MEYLHWGWLMAHSLTYALLPWLILTVTLVGFAWYRGLAVAWYGLVLLAGVLVLGVLALVGLGVGSAPTARGVETALRVAHLNSYFFTPQSTPEKLAFAVNSQAEVVSLLEVNPALAERLPDISSTYPFQQKSAGKVPMVLLSIYPLTRAQAFGERLVLYHVARPAPQGGAFYVLQVHPRSPSSLAHTFTRNLHLARLAAALPTLPHPVLLVGDFNTTPWDDALQPFRTAFQMVGGWRAWLPTFPAWVPMTPIDHMFATPEFRAVQFQRVRVKGADHLGLVADFAPRL